RGQLEGRHRPKKRVRYLDEQARTVAGVHFRALRAAVVEVAQCPERRVDDVPALRPRHIDNEADAARVVLKAWIVEAAGRRERAKRQRPRRTGRAALGSPRGMG